MAYSMASRSSSSILTLQQCHSCMDSHRSVLLKGVKANSGCEVTQSFTRPPPLLVHVQHRLQRLLYVLQQQC